MTVAELVTIHATVSYPGDTPAHIAWTGTVPWPSLPRERDRWVCCPQVVYKTRFEEVSYRGPGHTAQAVLITATVPAAQANHLTEVHGFAPAEPTD
jgi:hypothetical protein